MTNQATFNLPDDNMRTALNALEDYSFEGELRPQVLRDFNDLSDRAGRQNDISIMLGYKDKADSLLKTYLDRIAKLIQEQRGHEPGEAGEGNSGENNGGSKAPGIADPVNPPKKLREVKNIMIRDITSKTWIIHDEKDLDQYIDQVKKSIAKNLDGNTDLYINF